MNLISEPFGTIATFFEHLISLIKYKHFKSLKIKMSLLYHIEHSPRRPTDHMHPHLKSFNILLHGFPSNTSMYLDIEMITESRGNFLTLLGELSDGGQHQDLRGSYAGVDSLEGA